MSAMTPEARPRKRAPAFSASQMTRALKAAAAGGMVVVEAKIAPDGSIQLRTADGSQPPADEYEAWRRKRDQG